MLFKSFLVGATLSGAALLDPRSPCGDGPTRVCYGIDGGESQHLSVDDIKYVADYLRYLDSQNDGDARFWKMPKAMDCAEWTLPVPDAGSVLALAKHIKPRVNSSILYTDLATAIDGGVGAADGGSHELLGCGEKGGQFGATGNMSNPAYSTDEYKKSGATPDGILIKLVKATQST